MEPILYPIQKIGPAQQANLRAALSLGFEGKTARVGVSVTEPRLGAVVRLTGSGRAIAEWDCDLAPGKPFTGTTNLSRGVTATDLRLALFDDKGNELIHYAPAKAVQGDIPKPASEPPGPGQISSSDELYVTGLHLEQYRHATRSPEPYWREALRRDPGDARCNTALGVWHLRRGELHAAEAHFQKAIERLTARNPNPLDGGAYYYLGLTRVLLGCHDAAYDAFYKATWNQEWQPAGFHALAEIDIRKGRLSQAREHLERALRVNADNLRASNLLVIVLQRLGESGAANALLKTNLALDPLDVWARHLRGDELFCGVQTLLDIALDYARGGLYAEARVLLARSQGLPEPGAEPLREYYLGWLCEQSGGMKEAAAHYRRATKMARDYCFPARIEEISILQAALRFNPKDATALYYLGNLYYGKRRHEEAIRLWEASAKIDPSHSVVLRNLGIGYFNVRKQPRKACNAYDRAFRANPIDARLLYERDQLWKRLGRAPAQRLREIEGHRDLADRRDDLSVELCTLYNQTGQHDKALAILTTRKFQPWEGGEGQVLGQHVRTHLCLGRRALTKGSATKALAHFQQALAVPANLGEGRHLLANASDIHYWLGCAHAAMGNKADARKHWKMAARFHGDFQNMRVQPFSELTYYSALALDHLGKKKTARDLLRNLLHYAQLLAKQAATIDYFATSLPTMLIFDDDLEARQTTSALFLQAQAKLGLGKHSEAAALHAQVLKRDPNHALAQDLTTLLTKRNL
ncbi:MAG TPA: tetratricopeptide repeat protein [Candidatus Methylacidiphilales bacterium]